MVRYYIVVDGQVQDVGFRYYTSRIANQYQIKGWVKNRVDGTVAIDAEGSESKMKQFLRGLKEGSRRSVVRNVRINKLTELRDYQSFQVKY